MKVGDIYFYTIWRLGPARKKVYSKNFSHISIQIRQRIVSLFVCQLFMIKASHQNYLLIIRVKDTQHKRGIQLYSQL